MARIEISVQNRVAWQTNSTDYICGNSDFEVGFIFDKEWDEFETKTARFIHGGEHTDIVFTGNECKVPKILNVKRMEVGVFAGNLYTTTPAFVHCRKSILCESGAPADPTPDVYAQVMERLNEGVTPDQIADGVERYMEENPVTPESIGALPTEKLNEAVNDALAKAKASGAFDGADGLDGQDGQDGYTPQKGVDYFDGKDGNPGADGKTPIKGEDYFTEADKQEIANAVIAALPKYNGEVVAE
jgi:hypothetical protein